MNIKPKQDFLLVEIIEQNTDNKIYLLTNSLSTLHGRIIAKSDGYWVGKKFKTIDAEVGDITLLEKGAGKPIKFDDTDTRQLRLIKEDEIKGIIT